MASSRLRALDDERLRALCAPLRPVHVNAEAHAAKIGFWTDVVHQLLIEDDLLLLDLQYFQQKLAFSDDRLRDVRVCCLNEVLHKLVDAKSLVSEENFWTHSLSWSAWMAASASRALKSWMRIEDDSSKNLVNLVALDKLGSKVHEEVFDSLTCAEEFKDKTFSLDPKSVIISEELLESKVNKIVSNDAENQAILLEHLRRVPWTQFEASQQLWKISKRKSDTVTKFSQDELTMIRLITRLIRLEQETRDDEILAMEKRNLAKIALNNKQRQTARMHLRVALRLESSLSRKTRLVDQLHSIVGDLRANKEAKEHADLLQMAIKAYKANQMSLQEAEEIIDDIKECQDETKALQDTIASEQYEDDAELERELEQLVDEQSLVDALAKLDTCDSELSDSKGAEMDNENNREESGDTKVKEDVIKKKAFQRKSLLS